MGRKKLSHTADFSVVLFQIEGGGGGGRGSDVFDHMTIQTKTGLKKHDKDIVLKFM